MFWVGVALPLLAEPMMYLVFRFVGSASYMAVSYAISLVAGLLPLFLIARVVAGRMVGTRDSGALELVLTSSIS